MPGVSFVVAIRNAKATLKRALHPSRRNRFGVTADTHHQTS
ncbi:hypothetical protein C7441_114116 [Pseudaminobacter salicylatoxidans]|uniref:Uncharacterized protein n=1 Tax=Pseudaminobacter salicylatoxidans TaxID=93369 RepID=A0A316BYX4_PSESE|nr:hypothetical protein C7441_114116 [Pseudaminobacter salicylatoxidans]